MQEDICMQNYKRRNSSRYLRASHLEVGDFLRRSVKQKAYTKKENRIRYTDGRFDYVKTFSLSEKPVNLIIRKSDLLRIAGYDCNNPNKKYGHYFITKEYGLQRQPTFWNFSRGKWLNKTNYSEF